MSAPTEEQALAFAKYHAEHAAHGGAGREFHLRAETFLLELARVSAERDAAVKERDEAHEAMRLLSLQDNKHQRELDAALAKVKALREALEAAHTELDCCASNDSEIRVGEEFRSGHWCVQCDGSVDRNGTIRALARAALASEVPPQPTTRVALTTPTDKDKM